MNHHFSHRKIFVGLMSMHCSVGYLLILKKQGVEELRAHPVPTADQRSSTLNTPVERTGMENKMTKADCGSL